MSLTESLDVKREGFPSLHEVVYFNTIGSGGTLLDSAGCASDDEVRHSAKMWGIAVEEMRINQKLLYPWKAKMGRSNASLGIG